VTIVIILLGVALAASLAFNLGLVGNSQPTQSAQASSNTSASTAAKPQTDDERARKLEGDLEKKKKELEESKKGQAELRDELKAAKKKLFDQNQAEKSGDDLSKARAEVERQASIQLESTRAELATALADIQRLKTLEENRGKKRPERTNDEKPVEKAAAPVVEKPAEVVTRVIRELNDVEKERIAKLEAQSSNDRKKANELERETRSLRAKVDRIQRESKRVYGESNLARDKFRAVETRLNRTLLENDLLKRAIVDIEKKTGQHAEHTQPTAEEFAAADKSMKERHAAEDKQEAEARARLEAMPAAGEEEAAPVAAAAAAAPEVAAAATPAAEPTTPPATA
jgi:chromosome segregation ATPase